MEQVRDPGGIARLAIAAAWLFLAGDLLLAGARLNTLVALGQLGGPIAPMPRLEKADALTVAAGLLFVILYVLAVVVIARWIYVANRNAQAWSAHVEMSPGWNVGWFFVPIANLWKPFDGVRSTYQASVDPDEPASVPVPATMRWWWGAWVTTGILGNVSLQISERMEGTRGVIAAAWLDIAAVPIDLLLVLALAAVIRRTTAVQQARLSDAPAA